MVNVDQRGFDNQSSAGAAAATGGFIGGDAAARLLGVKRQTLYAYASRGLVRSEPGPRGRARLYARDDLERLKARHDARSGHGPVAGGALRWGEPVLETRVGTIDARGPIYRGLLAVDLADAGRSFEATAELLWTAALPDVDPIWPRRELSVDVADLARLVPRRSRPVDALAMATAAIALADDARFGATPELELVRGRALVLDLAALLGLAHGKGRARAALKGHDVAARVLLALAVSPTDAAREAVTRALVLLCDHELNASSFAVRVAASTGADLYACVGAGLAALSGPRHGGAIERVEAFMSEIGDASNASAVVAGRARRGEALPGFGHPLYPAGDPRATPLLRTALALTGREGSPRVRTILAVVAAVKRRGGPLPTVDVGLAALAAALDLPPGAGAALFAIGRCAGWIAHALEQRAAGFLLRPRARYEGPTPA